MDDTTQQANAQPPNQSNLGFSDDDLAAALGFITTLQGHSMNIEQGMADQQQQAQQQASAPPQVPGAAPQTTDVSSEVEDLKKQVEELKKEIKKGPQDDLAEIRKQVEAALAEDDTKDGGQK